MKILILITTLFFIACNTPYYTTVNDMKGQPASITLTNGNTLNGKATIKMKTNYYDLDRIFFAEGIEKEYKPCKINEVKSIYINGATYFVKTIASNNSNRDIQKFVKQISQAGGRMALYENEYATKNNNNNSNATNTSFTEKTVQYFIQLPGDSTTIFDVTSSKFTPKFNEKMSSYVQDCPALAEKISSKNKDYFYPFLMSDNSPKRKAVLLQIINEYNSCK